MSRKYWQKSLFFEITQGKYRENTGNFVFQGECGPWGSQVNTFHSITRYKTSIRLLLFLFLHSGSITCDLLLFLLHFKFSYLLLLLCLILGIYYSVTFCYILGHILYAIIECFTVIFIICSRVIEWIFTLDNLKIIGNIEFVSCLKILQNRTNLCFVNTRFGFSAKNAVFLKNARRPLLNP